MVSDFIQWYKENGPNPLVTAMLAGVGTYGLTRLLSNPIIETGKALAYPYVSRLGEDASYKLDRKIENWKQNGGAHKLGLIGGALGLLGTAAFLYNPRQHNFGGLFKWDSPVDRAGEAQVIKTAALTPQMGMGANLLDNHNSIVSNINWGQPINAHRATSLIDNDPLLQGNPYIRNLGCSIINNAAINQQTRQPTLGGIFDSAKDKLEKKLTFQGMFNTGVRTVVANGAARLFTGAIGTMCNLSPNAQKSIISAGTWAGAIKSILD